MSDGKARDSEKYNAYSLLTPRFWHGMQSRIWWSMLAEHGFRISPSKLHHFLGVSLATPFNDVLGLIQHLVHGNAIQKTELVKPPIFIIGHWRSGTTYLHELLELDKRFASPNTYQCFAPWHFLLTEWIAVHFFQFLLPSKRPMDNMRAGWELPQEDEFALMNLGAASNYRRVAFPREPLKSDHAPDGDEVEPWKKSLDWFMRALTYHYQKPLVLKSPPHTGRIDILHEMYPEAKFIHIVRDPMKLYPSTVRLWRALDHFQSLQSDSDATRIENHVLRSLKAMYDRFNQHRSRLGPKQLFEIHYEQLTASPEATLERVYQQLELGDFETVRPRIQDRVRADKEYKTNEWRPDPELRAKILQHWGEYARQYGYE